MDKESIINKIISEANQEAESIVDEAKKEIDKKVKEDLELIKDYKQKKIKEANKQAIQIKENEISNAELKARNMILEQKEKILRDTNKKIKERLYNLDGDKYVNFIMQILKNSKLLDIEGAEIILPEKQREKIIKVLDGKFKICDEVGDFSGGFIVKKDNIEYNYVFNTILDLEKEKFDNIIVKVLFN